MQSIIRITKELACSRLFYIGLMMNDIKLALSFKYTNKMDIIYITTKRTWLDTILWWLRIRFCSYLLYTFYILTQWNVVSFDTMITIKCLSSRWNCKPLVLNTYHVVSITGNSINWTLLNTYGNDENVSLITSEW